jgi:carboxyl-terminal processing protease
VQTIFPLSGGAGLTLTTARYYTPSGRLIQRDYSNGSVYDYLFRRNAQGETLIRRLTSKRGRPISAARSLVEAGSNRISRLRRPS